MGDVIATHAIPVMALLVGHATQILMTLASERKQGHDAGIAGYFRQRPYGSIIAILGSVGGYLMLIDSGQLTAVAAWGMGYAADHVIKTLTERSEVSRS